MKTKIKKLTESVLSINIKRKPNVKWENVDCKYTPKHIFRKKYEQLLSLSILELYGYSAE